MYYGYCAISSRNIELFIISRGNLVFIYRLDGELTRDLLHNERDAVPLAV